MANEFVHFAERTFIQQVDTPRDIVSTLVDGERALVSFRTIRDTATFTNRRLIVRDSQGITGKKVECYSLPWTP